jgi:signal transduction histidine kinase
MAGQRICIQRTLIAACKSTSATSMPVVRLRWSTGCGITRGNTAGYWIEGCPATRRMERSKDMLVVVSTSMARKKRQKVRIADDITRLMKAQDEERRRIARELHDSAGQTLTVLGLSLAGLVEQAQVIAPELAKEGKEIEGVVQQLHREIRTTFTFCIRRYWTNAVSRPRLACT